MTLYKLDELQTLARKMAKQTSVPYALGLEGDLGAGKTTFAQAFIKHFDPTATVTSPTFPIAQYYDNGRIAHYDLYRLKSPDELLDLDIFEDLHTKICLIEWPGILNEVLDHPIPVMHISVEDEEKRRVRFD
ncbi:MAG: tRNA (adenosine(37)-N6)-threonylcarbamoyltransferase complex ATPase subunit type 1 TsaE [Alphaproteobacteria bacterium]|nr:MAG: tRNA (adenosine(37)-N6)-threonylcarbamoyltransferase complex ATPase subunit type 1 TsaE [Alphaproteobacteria bacterium]